MLKYKNSTGEKKFKNKPSAAELNAQGLRQQGACKFGYGTIHAKANDFNRRS